MESDDEARARLIVQATRQTYVAQIAAVRMHVVTGGLLAGAGIALFAFCIYLAITAGDTSMLIAGLGFVLVVAGATRSIGALARGISAERKLRAHDAAALPAARLIVKP